MNFFSADAPADADEAPASFRHPGSEASRTPPVQIMAPFQSRYQKWQYIPRPCLHHLHRCCRELLHNLNEGDCVSQCLTIGFSFRGEVVSTSRIHQTGKVLPHAELRYRAISTTTPFPRPAVYRCKQDRRYFCSPEGILHRRIAIKGTEEICKAFGG